MRGPAIIARTLSLETVTDGAGRIWQYHSRSDRHSKVACWAVLFDLLQTSSVLQRHVDAGRVAFGINRRINDFQTGRKKDLDLVVARTDGQDSGAIRAFDLTGLADTWDIGLDGSDRAVLNQIPAAGVSASGATVLVALEAKATMTAHVRALPRLYDELTSSHATVHGDNNDALAIGFVLVNIAGTFVSPGRQTTGLDPVINTHRQPHDTERTIAKLREIARRPGPHSPQHGFDALGVLVVDMANDGSPVTVVTGPPAPGPGDDFQYDRMVTRAAHLYDQTFGHL